MRATGAGAQSPRASRACPTARPILCLAHDPEKCERFSDKIMRKIKDAERASVSIETDRALRARLETRLNRVFRALSN